MKWATTQAVNEEIEKIINAYNVQDGAPGVELIAIKLRNLALLIQADMSAEIAKRDATITDLTKRIDAFEEAADEKEALKLLEY